MKCKVITAMTLLRQHKLSKVQFIKANEDQEVELMYVNHCDEVQINY